MTEAGGIAGPPLRSVVERIERLEEEKKAIADDIKDVFAEAKANGFDTKILRTVIRLRKMDKAEREEQDALLDLYLEALGMLAGTPLGEAAVRREFDGVVGSPAPKKPRRTSVDERVAARAAAIGYPARDRRP
jgi:uncharacterized protein (UPF0335 family)